MGSASSKLAATGRKAAQSLKTKVDNLPCEGITQEELDRILAEGHFRPKTDALLQQARERAEEAAKNNGAAIDETIRYVQEKDKAFLSHLESSMNGGYSEPMGDEMASESIVKEQMPFKSTGTLPTDRTNSKYEAKHIPGQLSTEEWKELFNSSALLSTIEGQHKLGVQYGLSPETMDSLMKYVALPKLEKLRPDTKELDAVWPSWKKETQFCFCLNKHTNEIVYKMNQVH